MSASLASPPLKKPGRPRSVTLDAVIEAACDLGIDRIEMSAVAERLGVGVGTLYRYVKDRDHLVELVAARRSRQAGIVDRGQSWQDILREAAAIAYETFCRTPELIVHIMSATIADETDALSTEPRLRLLVDRGFTPAEALSLLQQTQQVVAGAVVSVSFKRAVEAKFGSYGGLVRHVAATLGDDQVPLLSEAIRTSGDPAIMGDYRPTLELILTDHARRLAEKTVS